LTLPPDIAIVICIQRAGAAQGMVIAHGQVGEYAANRMLCIRGNKKTPEEKACFLPSLSKKYFRQTANGSQLKQSSIRSITFTAKMAFQPCEKGWKAYFCGRKLI